MSSDAENPRDEEQIASLLAELKEPPRAWIEAAKQLPALSDEIDELIEHADSDPDFRRRLAEDMEEALKSNSYAPTPQLVGALRARLDG